MKHMWRKVSELLSNETATYKVCKRCGVVQRKDQKNPPCKGKVGLRKLEKPNAM